MATSHDNGAGLDAKDPGSFLERVTYNIMVRRHEPVFEV